MTTCTPDTTLRAGDILGPWMFLGLLWDDDAERGARRESYILTAQRFDGRRLTGDTAVHRRADVQRWAQSHDRVHPVDVDAVFAAIQHGKGELRVTVEDYEQGPVRLIPSMYRLWARFRVLGVYWATIEGTGSTVENALRNALEYRP